MKLRNKLIPLMSAATVAATIAPVALTSCSAGMVSLLNGYRPTIKKAVWEDFKSNKKDMLAFYMSAVNENPEIFAQDIYWKYATESYYDAEYYGSYYYLNTKIIDLQAKASNIEVKKLTCDYTDTEGKRQTIDYYTVSMDFVLKATTESNDDDENTKTSGELSISVKNVPITINREGTAVNKDIPNWMWELYYNYNIYLIDLYQIIDRDDCFAKGFLPTQWMIQPLVDVAIDYDEEYYELKSITIDHASFTNLENNGYEWYIKANEIETQTITPFKTNEPETITSNFVFEFTKDSQFVTAQKAIDEFISTKKEPLSLELNFAKQIYKWYLPTFYLSDILDEKNQLWKEGE